VLARAGLELAASTARRMLNKARPEAPAPPPRPVSETQQDLGSSKRVVAAKRPHQVWHADITTINHRASGSGFWTPGWPFSLVLRWAMSWHIAVVVDHFSRALLAFGVFRKEPTAAQLCALLDRATLQTGASPRYLVTDRGAQFGALYRAWCARIALRLASAQSARRARSHRRALHPEPQRELLWKVFVPASLARMEALLASYQRW